MIDNAQSNLDGLETKFKEVVSGGGGVKAFNYSNFHLETQNGQTHDFRSQFKSFSDSIEALLDSFFMVLSILEPAKATFDFEVAANALSSLVERYSENIEKLNIENLKLTDTVSQAAKQVFVLEEQASIAKETVSEVIRVKDEAARDRKTVGEYLADAVEKKKSIEAAYNEASVVEGKVEEYEEKFQSFDRQLEDRNRDFDDGKKRQEELFEDFDGQRKLVKHLIEDSESMLKGATVAGLASSFSDAHTKLGKQLFWARVSFYIGITFLFVSAIPLMLYVFFPLVSPILQTRYPELAGVTPNLDVQGEMSGWQYLGQVLARFIILLPAAWLVSFSAIRHSSLFRLREHYAYKYSMAVSVEGFRKQAVGYESEIAALVLEQLAFNPADKLVPSKEVAEGKVPHPLLNVFLEKFRSGMNKD
ncbi:hypothetical protein CDZ96_26210 [Mameliella alba]|nr:hypothetical protein CDZ96_26210 [Mameliella alba]